jgi:hypothetical protein
MPHLLCLKKTTQKSGYPRMVTGENNSETYCTKKTSNAQQFKFDTHN